MSSAGDDPQAAFARISAARFRHPWRPYQARVLETLDRHLRDDHLHVVAPPGSGKTVLGLEALRRLGRPALVLAPTVTIREQWIARLLADFIAPQGLDGLLARELRRDAALSFLTYQGLYTRFQRDGEAAVLATLRACGVGVLAVDEAHHLRAEWWRCLDRLKCGLAGVQVLALTATPPFDAPAREWQRYRAFCGEVDEEIGVPELVADGTLCPHQDLLLLFAPDPPAARTLAQFERDVATLVTELALDAELADHCAALPEVREPQAHLATLARHPEFWLALLVFLGNQRWEAARALAAALGLDGVPLPAFDVRWAEQLLHGLLVERVVKDALAAEPLARLRQRLQAIGALQHRRLGLRAHPRRARLLDSASGMIATTAEIVQAELQHFGASLRMVVLSGHIRVDCLPRPGQPAPDAPPLGVVPLFERIRQLRLPGLQPALLTGRLLVLPVAALPDWQAALAGAGIDPAGLPGEPLCHDSGFQQFALDARLRAPAVALVTALFERGVVNLLCGTNALLGEGWDAPAVNSLVLASPVSAHVSSNQLRGRGIRAQRGDPHKVANLWHLAGVEIGALHPAPPADMQARFHGFIGLCADRDQLQSGLQRLGDCRQRMPAEAVQAWNRQTLRHAAEASLLAARWRRAIGAPAGAARGGRMHREMRLPVAAQRWAPALLLRRGRVLPGLGWLADWWACRHLRALARCVAAALGERGVLTTPALPQVAVDADGSLRVLLEGAEYLAQAQFIEALAELVDPRGEPRYLLIHRRQPYALPQALSRRRADAEAFLRHWRREVGRGELVATRSPEGRLRLLRAREQLLARHPDWQVERRSGWTPGRA